MSSRWRRTGDPARGNAAPPGRPGLKTAQRTVSRAAEGPRRGWGVGAGCARKAAYAGLPRSDAAAGQPVHLAAGVAEDLGHVLEQGLGLGDSLPAGLVELL